MKKSLTLMLLIFSTLNFSYSQTLNVPPSPAGALTGTQFYDATSTYSQAARENAVIAAVTSGDVPNFMRTLVPVTVTTTYGSSTHTAVFYVLPDFLAVGVDSDYFLMPLTPLSAQTIADMLKCNLPTTQMADLIDVASLVKLEPATISPSAYDRDVRTGILG